MLRDGLEQVYLDLRSCQYIWLRLMPPPITLKGSRVKNAVFSGLRRKVSGSKALSVRAAKRKAVGGVGSVSP